MEEKQQAKISARRNRCCLGRVLEGSVEWYSVDFDSSLNGSGAGRLAETNVFRSLSHLVVWRIIRTFMGYFVGGFSADEEVTQILHPRKRRSTQL